MEYLPYPETPVDSNLPADGPPMRRQSSYCVGRHGKKCSYENQYVAGG